MTALLPFRVVSGGRTWSRPELEDRALAWRAAIAAADPPAGRPLALVMDNHPEAVTLLAALASFPSPIVLLPPQARAWTTSPPVPMGMPLYLPPRSRGLAPAGEALGLRVTVLDDGRSPGDAGAARAPALLQLRAPGVVCFTSGSSARPRPVYRTFAKVFAQAAASAGAFGLSPESGVLAVLPLSRNVGLNRGLVQAVISNASLGLHASLDHRAILESFASGEYGHVSGTPHFADVMSRCALFAPAPPAPRHVNIAGGRLPRRVAAAFADRFGVMPVSTYGTTECGVVSIGDDGAGRAVPGVSIRVGSDPGHPVPEGVAGPIWVSSPWCMEGYGYPPDIEAAAWDGWLATGDVGALDRDGGLRLFGRADESFKTTANYLVNPSAIADALTAHPGVRDAVVVPVPYRGGTSIAALAEVSGAIDAAEVRRHAERCLPPWLVPHFLGVAGRFPRLPDGKIDRQAAIRMLERQLVDGGR